MGKQNRSKPTYYLWKSKSMTNQELQNIEEQKKFWTNMGFRVTVFVDGKQENMQDAMLAVVKNHMLDK